MKLMTVGFYDTISGVIMDFLEWLDDIEDMYEQFTDEEKGFVDMTVYSVALQLGYPMEMENGLVMIGMLDEA